jgi:hypothetical protein
VTNSLGDPLDQDDLNFEVTAALDVMQRCRGRFRSTCTSIIQKDINDVKELPIFRLARCIGYSGHLHASENVQCEKIQENHASVLC